MDLTKICSPAKFYLLISLVSLFIYVSSLIKFINKDFICTHSYIQYISMDLSIESTM